MAQVCDRASAKRERTIAHPRTPQQSLTSENIYLKSPSSKCEVALLVTLGMILLSSPARAYTSDEYSVTAMVGGNVILNCHIEFPDAGHPVPYVVQWEKKGLDVPVYIWYDGYPTHSAPEFLNRVSHLDQNSGYGWASLNISDVKETDQGWYECKVVLLNRPPKAKPGNGTWFYLDVHAPPHFLSAPDDIVYVSIGDQIILNCVAEGSPAPEVMWYRDGEPVHPSPSVGVVNDGTELRLAFVRHEDIGDYDCVARNSKGRVTHTTKIVVAGSAVIVEPPRNQTRMEGEEVELPCEARGHPGNFSTKWTRDSLPINQIPGFDSRANQRRDGALVITPVAAEDQGLYCCEVSNGIGESQSASAFLEVAFPARVTFVQTVQYLPLGLSGVVQCFFEANPPVNLVTWTKDRKILDTSNTPGVTYINNGTLVFQNVTVAHQGHYTCTPFNYHGTAGSSAKIDVLVREPPIFTVKPKPVYQKKADEEVTLPCEGQGSPPPVITWRRVDGRALPRDRARIENGYLVISTIRRTDFGVYECVIQNEIATLSTRTQLLIEGTTPHAPYNVTAKATEFSVEVEWLPGYSGGLDYQQDYQIWYKLETADKWTPVDVPSGATKYMIHNLQPGTMYEFQVVGKNVLGDGMLSGIIKEKTKEISDYSVAKLPLDPAGKPYYPKLNVRSGPRPNAPSNLTITEAIGGFILTWNPPKEDASAVAYYTVDYQVDTTWKRLSKSEIKPSETSFLVKNLIHGKTYHFRVNGHTLTNQASSEVLKLQVPQRVKDKAITAGVVGGILFFIVAIILSVCAVKICNKRRRRKQEKAYNMVACRITEARNGSQAKSVPVKKGRSGGLPLMMGLEDLNQSVTSIIFKDCFHFSDESSSDYESEPRDQSADSEWVSSDRGLTQWGRSEKPRLRFRPKPRYQVQTEYTQPQGYITRSSDGRFKLDDVDESPAKRRRTGDLPPWLISEPLPVKKHDYVNTQSASAYINHRRQYPGIQESPIIESGFYRIGGDNNVPARPILRREFSGVLGSCNQGFLRTPGQPPVTPSVATIYNPSSYYTPGSKTYRSVRSSSPGPISGSFMDDLSSVAVPSSVERSFPSTLLTSDATPQSGDRSRSELPSLTPLTALTPVSTVPRFRGVSQIPLDTPVRRLDHPSHYHPVPPLDNVYIPLLPSNNMSGIRPRRHLVPLSIDTAVARAPPPSLRSPSSLSREDGRVSTPASATHYPPKSPDSRSLSSVSQRVNTPVRFAPHPQVRSPISPSVGQPQARVLDPLYLSGYQPERHEHRQSVKSPGIYSISSGSQRISSPEHNLSDEAPTIRYLGAHSRHTSGIHQAEIHYQPPNRTYGLGSVRQPPNATYGLTPVRQALSSQTWSQSSRPVSPRAVASPDKPRIFPYLSPPGSRRKLALQIAREENYPLLPQSEQRPLATSSPPHSRAEPQRHSMASVSSGRGSAQVPPPPQQESISSSSGFDSRNTSQQNQSGSSGSQSALQASSDSSRLKPMPRMRSKLSRSLPDPNNQYANIPPPLPRDPPPPLPPKSSYSREPAPTNILDASVDNHYEFDSAQSPVGTSDATWEHSEVHRVEASLYIEGTDGTRTVEDRVKAIRQEYEIYRRKRERLESSC